MKTLQPSFMVRAPCLVLAPRRARPFCVRYLMPFAAALLIGLAIAPPETLAQQRYAQQPNEATPLEWATALVREKRFDEAEALLNQLDISYFPDEVRRIIRLLRADIDLSRGKFGFAKTTVTFALQKLEYGDPGHAYALDLMDRIEAAERAYEAKRDAESKAAWASITGSFNAPPATTQPSGETPAPRKPAAQQATDVSQPDVATLDALFAQFGTQFNAQNWAAAKATLRKIDAAFATATLQPSPVYYGNYAVVLYHLGEYPEAKRQLARYFQMASPDEPNYQNVLEFDKQITAAMQ